MALCCGEACIRCQGAAKPPSNELKGVRGSWFNLLIFGIALMSGTLTPQLEGIPDPAQKACTPYCF